MGAALSIAAGAVAAKAFGVLASDAAKDSVKGALSLLPEFMPRCASMYVGIAGAIATQTAICLSKPARQPCTGAVFITGCDSGMGQVTAIHLSTLGFVVFAALFKPENEQSLRELVTAAGGNNDKFFCVALDVTKPESVTAAVDTVKDHLSTLGVGLFGIINCAGLGYTGPAEYFPMAFYRNQMEVNFFGYVAVTQALLPLVREATSVAGSRRGLVVFVGTGGGVLTPAPALLSAYMASKWAGEAFIQVLRMEMQLTNQRIDACMVNPGFIKPTALMSVGKELLEKVWKAMDPRARTEYEGLVDTFLKFSEDQPGTHPRYIAKAMEDALTAGRPNSSYKVGIDSNVSPYVGMLPTRVREFIVRKSMFGQ
jgi:NAD(P)-dependent dehydrogenase (short-subunit alcohol dehydrogenase family)